MAKFHVYPDARGEWRWRFRADGGRIVADSGEGYVNKKDCLDAIEILKKEATTAITVEEKSRPS